MIYKSNCYILTGGPGAGKTSVLNELERLGYLVVPEIAREIIKEQKASSGDALPWKDTLLYKQIMAKRTIESFRQAPASAICFFDRGIGDVLAYGKLINAPEDEQLHEAALEYRCNKKVFLFPPWKEIYTTDTERKQDFEEALTTYHVIKTTYQQYNYQPIEVPLASVAARAQSILEHVTL